MSSVFAPEKIAQLSERMARCQQLGYDYESRATHLLPTCNVCKTNKTFPVTNTDRYGFTVGCTECKNCGCAWLSPRLQAADYQDFYSHWYRPILSAWYGYEFTAESIEADQTRYAKVVCESLNVQFAKKAQGTLLDVGGSTGIMAQALADMFALKPTVLDPAELELERAAARGFTTIHGCIETTGIFERFDVITMFQTIEHLTDPRSVVTKLKCMLNPGGILVFDCNQWQQQKNAKPIEQFVKIDHLYYFSDYSIRWLLDAVGLRLCAKVCCVNNKWHYVCQA